MRCTEINVASRHSRCTSRCWHSCARAEASFAVAEKHLSDRRFVLGDAPTIVDLSMAGYVYYPPDETGFDIATTYPAIDAWRKRIAALPGWKLPYEMMPIGGSPPMRAV